MKGVPSGLRFLVRPGLPCFLDTPYTHGEPLAVQRAHKGCSLEHLTFEAAQASHEARSLSLRSLSDLHLLGAAVDEDMMKVTISSLGARVVC